MVTEAQAEKVEEECVFIPPGLTFLAPEPPVGLAPQQERSSLAFLTEPFSRPHISPGWDTAWLRVKGRVSSL